VYTARRPGSLCNLTYRWQIEGFNGLLTGLERILCGYYAAELVLNLTAEGDPCPGLYRLLVDCLRQFALGRALGLTVLWLEAGVLREHGSLPSFDSCITCGAAPPKRGMVVFTAADGGPMCVRCERQLVQSMRARTRAFRGRWIAGLADLCSAAGDPSELNLKPTEIIGMSRVLRFHIRDLLGKELRMWKYLQNRQLSRSLQIVRKKAGL
jgi:DNA repair protein RecO (recombination protein O)